MLAKVPRRLRSQKPKETFTKVIQGKKASDLEERFARALDKLGYGYTFRYQISQFGGSENLVNTTGTVEVDFLVSKNGLLQPVQVDGEIAHYKAAWQREKDAQKDLKANEFFQQYGALPLVRIPFWDLDTQDRANLVTKRLMT